MGKTWSEDNPKAALMARKRAAIVAAATRAFLETGYAATSVNLIADEAEVSIKTLYRHFSSKDELFSAVMEAACAGDADAEEAEAEPRWYRLPPEKGLQAAGREYLHHVLSERQLALYRVVTRDAHRFPDLGRRYHDQTTASHVAIFGGYIERWASLAGWKMKDHRSAAQVYAALLKTPLFEQVLLGAHTPTDAEIATHARRAAKTMLGLLAGGTF